MRLSIVPLLLGLISLQLLSPSWALLQSDFQLIGVSQDLKQLGVAETWVDDGSGFARCELRLYARNQWEPIKIEQIALGEVNEEQPKANCASQQAAFRKKHNLHAINWDAAPFSPEPVKIKDEEGRLIPDAMEGQPFPDRQRYQFILGGEQPWEILVNSQPNPRYHKDITALSQEAMKPVPFRIVVRPKAEPVPFDVIENRYDNTQILLTPIKVLTNAHYGLVILMFRDTRLGFEGSDYFYRPYFMPWPDYQELAVEEARDLINESSEYIFLDSEFSRNPNGMHKNYRAFMRLKTQQLTRDDILGQLNHASPAGQLYWLALLGETDPDLYRTEATRLLQSSVALNDIIINGSDTWETVPFADLLKEQTQQIGQPLNLLKR